MVIELFICLSFLFAPVLLECRPSKLGFIDFQTNPRRSSPFTVEIVAVKCPGMNKFYYKWEVEERKSKNILQTSWKSTIQINGYDFPSKNLFEKQFFLKVHISHYSDMSLSTSKSKAFTFKPDKMYLQIVGGAEKSHTANTDLMVDAKTLSKDPSYPPNEDAFEGNTINWTIQPQLPGVSSNNLILNVPGKLLKEGKVYNFTLKVTRLKIVRMVDSKTVYQIVKIVKNDLPELNIECIKNCINPHPKQTTILRVLCHRNCNNLNYKWNVQPSIDLRKTDFGDGFDKLLVEPAAFKPHDEAIFRVESGKAYSLYNMIFINDIKKGRCTISPSEGVSGITVFTVSCEGFISPSGVEICMIYQKNKEVKRVMINEDINLKENKIVLTEGNPAVVIIQVQDNAYMQAEVELKVNVKPFLASLNETSEIDAIKTLVLDDNVKSVLSFATENVRSKVVQMISFLLDGLNATKNVDDSVKKDLHLHMAESLEFLTIHDFSSATQMISILKKLQKFKLDADTETTRSISKSMAKAAVAMHNTVSHKSVNYPMAFVKNFVDEIVELSSDLLGKSKIVEIALQTIVKTRDYDSYDDMTFVNLKMRDDLREITEKIIISAQILSATLLHSNIPNQKASVFEKQLISFITRRVLLSSLLNQTISLLNVTQSKVLLPKTLINELEENYDYIDYQFAFFKENPFWWHKNSERLNAEVILFDLFTESIKLKTVKNPFYVFLKTLKVPIGELKGTITNLNRDNIIAHRITLKPQATLIIIFEPSTDIYKVTTSSCYCRNKDFLTATEIYPNSNDSQRTIRAETKNNKSIIYVCIMKIGVSKLNYKGKFSSFSCVYWNLKKGSWDSDGCKIKEAFLKNESFIKCECTHLSLFTGEIFVPPNEINFNLEIDFYITMIENWAMVLIVVMLLLVWILLMIWAWFRDKKLKNNNFICKLDDNVPGDKHIYLIVVFTGVFLDAGTTADVAFQIIGNQSASRVHLMKCFGISLLQRNSQDWLIIYTPYYLGQIKKIRLWHNCKGKNPHWYCQRILIQHLKSGVQFCFIVDKWFSLVWGSGKIYREIFVKKEIKLKSSKILFSVKFETQLKDKHLWLSLFTREAQSNFNCKERVSSGICSLFLSMLASAMFFGIPRKMPSDSIDSQSSFFITFREVIIALESALITIPASIIIVMLFRNSAP